MEEIGERFARRKALVLFTAAATTAILRLSLLWLIPVPVPTAHDEFSYLLAADTFAHGRVTNTSHPMWVFFETIHVNQHPNYMSKYPPGQGLLLAVGELLGQPWIGVLLGMTAMCVSVVWMLQGWLPPSWALLGGVLVVLRFAAFNYWIDSYWGGSLAATGGALTMGALPRLFRRPRSLYAVELAIGLTMLAYSRPVEGLVFSLPLAVVFCAWLLRARPPWSAKLWKGVVPLAVVMGATMSWLGYYNWRNTGDPLLFPYLVYERAYFTSPPLLVQRLPAARQFLNPQLTDQSEDQRAEYREHRARMLLTIWRRTRGFLLFLCGPLLAAPLITLPWLLRDLRMRLLWVQLLICWFVLMAITFFSVHYAAPLTATVFALAMQGMRHLRRWHWGETPVGILFTRAIVLVCMALVPAHLGKTWFDVHHGVVWADTSMYARADIAGKLKATPGEHLVIVRYATGHDVHDEWVYNAADVDHAKVVWARQIPGVDLKPLLKYFHDRRVWIVEPDSHDIQLRDYPAPQTP